jgi:hypothetical protein
LELPAAGMWITAGVRWPEWNESRVEQKWGGVGDWNECKCTDSVQYNVVVTRAGGRGQGGGGGGKGDTPLT